MLSASWSKIIGLSALQGAISLTWLIYNIYLPKLLISYSFSPKLAVLVLIAENAMAVILEPFLGSLFLDPGINENLPVNNRQPISLRKVGSTSGSLCR